MAGQWGGRPERNHPLVRLSGYVTGDSEAVTDRPAVFINSGGG